MKPNPRELMRKHLADAWDALQEISAIDRNSAVNELPMDKVHTLLEELGISVAMAKDMLPHTQLVYAIGVEHNPGEFGMTHGPTRDLKEMLEVTGVHNAYIIRFDENGEEPLYQWNGDHWYPKNESVGC